MRGEHRYGTARRKQIRGSSPHARGAHLSIALSQSPRGIIPACAGSTVKINAINRTLGDHPRMRGEHKLFDGRAVFG